MSAFYIYFSVEEKQDFLKRIGFIIETMTVKSGSGFYSSKYKESIRKIDIARKPGEIVTYENGDNFEYDLVFYNVMKNKLLSL